MKPTEVGTEVFERAEVLMKGMSQLVDDIVSRRGTFQGTIKITAPSGFGNLFLNTIISDFMTEHPGIRTVVDLDDRFVDLKSGRYDFSIRIGRLKDSNLKARKIAQSKRGMFCSPDYLSRYGKPDSLEQLINHHCLHYANATSGHIWSFEADGSSKTQALSLSARMLSNSGEALKMASVKGLGIAALPHFMVRDEVRQGLLMQVNIPEWQMVSDNIYALYPDAVSQPEKVRAMIDYMSSRLQSLTPWEQ